MSARELDRFRRAQERFESQQEADVAGQAEERREREREQEAREASQQASGDRRLREAADRRDREIAESARQREEGIAASDRQLREAAERQEIGGDGLLRAEARRQRQEAERERELFDRELEEAAAERQRELEEADRELFEAAERQQEQFEEEVFQQAIEAELDREERLRDLQPEPEPEMEQRIDRGVGEPPSLERFEAGLGEIDRSLREASESIRRGGEAFFGQDVAVLGGESFTEQPGVVGATVTGAGRGVTAIADVPGTALGLAEIGRFAGERGVELATGRADEAVAETTQVFEAGLETGREAVTQRPVETAATVGASLVASGGLFGVASLAGRGAGTATRLAIQPGEELLGRGGFAATRAVRGEAAAERLFPQREPLIFSEEAALRAGSRVIDRARAADVRVRGIGAGVPAFEVEFETEDAVTREMQERLLEAEQRRVVPMQDAPPRSDLSPEGTFFEPRGLDPRTRRRLRLAQEQELAQEIELETERLRTELELFDAIDEEGLIEGINQRAAEVELVQEITEVETIQEQPPFETELFRPPAELETEIPPREVERPPAETEAPPIETELPPREIEVEPIPFPQADDDEDRFRLPAFRGVRAIEAELRPAELDLE